MFAIPAAPEALVYRSLSAASEKSAVRLRPLPALVLVRFQFVRDILALGGFFAFLVKQPLAKLKQVARAIVRVFICPHGAAGKRLVGHHLQLVLMHAVLRPQHVAQRVFVALVPQEKPFERIFFNIQVKAVIINGSPFRIVHEAIEEYPAALRIKLGSREIGFELAQFRLEGRGRSFSQALSAKNPARSASLISSLLLPDGRPLSMRVEPLKNSLASKVRRRAPCNDAASAANGALNLWLTAAWNSGDRYFLACILS